VDLNAFLVEIDERAEQAVRGGAEALGVPTASLGLFGGKRLRARMAFECAHALGSDPQPVLPVATAVELIHAASLCHDDVIDESAERRGGPTFNARFGNPLSVLFGDYLFSAAWLSVARGPEPEVARLLAEAMVAMSRAEIAQSRLLWSTAPAYDACMRVATGKTAALFAACAAATATAVQAPAAVVSALHTFGQSMGLAFQIIDDLLDYLPRSVAFGKRPLMDLGSGLPTLPLLFALEAGDGATRLSVLEFLRSHGQTPLDAACVADFVRTSGAEERCRQLARELVDQGLAALRGQVKLNGLAELARASVGRVS
jgi:octaprenyl-diphosphate synthase